MEEYLGKLLEKNPMQGRGIHSTFLHSLILFDEFLMKFLKKKISEEISVVTVVGFPEKLVKGSLGELLQKFMNEVLKRTLRESFGKVSGTTF